MFGSYKSSLGLGLRFGSVLPLVAVAVMAMLTAVPAQASSVTYTASGGTNASGTAKFVFTADTLTVTLTNTSTMHDPGELLTELKFSLPNFTPTFSPSLTFPISGSLVEADSDGPPFSSASPPAKTWSLSGSYDLAWGGGNSPAIISSTFPTGSLNPGLTSKSHKIVYYQSATFTLDIPGLTDNQSIDNVRIIFGTSGETPLTGTPDSVVPLPASLWLALSGGVVMFLGGVIIRKRAGLGVSGAL